MAVKYSGLLRFTDEIKAEINLAADGTVEKAVVIDGDGVETPIGGGGSSDFTTAEVTITNNLSDRVEISVPFIETHVEETYAQAAGVVGPSVTRTLTVILYKGTAHFKVVTPLGEGNEATATGSIVDAGRGFSITGNGAITFGTASEG